jgi:DNA-binding GntR family transcriptional regulator
MNKEEIIKLAIENTIHGLKFDEDGLERFAKLVAKHERESCAELCECSHDYSKGNFNYHATLIRARGQA